MGKNWPSKLIVHVPVIIRFSETPFNWHCTRGFLCKLCISTWNVLQGVLSRLRTIDFGMLWISIKFIISLIHKSSASLLTPSGFPTFPVVANLLTNPMRRKRLCTHGLPREKRSMLSSLLCLKSLFEVAIAILVLVTAPRFLATTRNF